MSDSGITAVLADVLRNDVLSVPASSFVVQYPNLFNGQASAVPAWCYTSLKDLWGMGAKSNEEWSRYVVDIFGLGRSSGNTIDITQFRVLDQADAPAGAYPKSNDIGAEMAEIHIMFKLPDAVPEEAKNRLYYSSMRVRRLLDYNYRVNTTRTRQFPSTDITIRSDKDLKVYWIGEVRNDDIKAWMCQYYAFYTKVCV